MHTQTKIIAIMRTCNLDDKMYTLRSWKTSAPVSFLYLSNLQQQKIFPQTRALCDMRAHTCAHPHTQTHQNPHAHLHVHTHAHAHAQFGTRAHTCTHAHTHTRTHAHIHERMHRMHVPLCENEQVNVVQGEGLANMTGMDAMSGLPSLPHCLPPFCSPVLSFHLPTAVFSPPLLTASNVAIVEWVCVFVCVLQVLCVRVQVLYVCVCACCKCCGWVCLCVVQLLCELRQYASYVKGGCH